MGTLNFPGLSTGIDTTQLIKSLMAINSRRLANYTVKKIRLGDQQTALDEMKKNGEYDKIINKFRMIK